MERCTVGHALAERAPRPDETALKSRGLAGFTAAHPNLVAGIADCFGDGRTPDDRFDDCLRVVVAGAAATA